MAAREPLMTDVSSESNDHRLRKLREDVRLVLEPRYDAQAIAGGTLIFVLLGGVAFSVGQWFGLRGLLSWWLLAIFGAAALAWAVVLPIMSPLWSRAVFDREAGTVALRGWRFRHRPVLRIADIAGIQLCGPVAHLDWVSYQLNLILAPRATGRDRLNLLDNGDRQALTSMAKELATFLRVPFEDDVEEPGRTRHAPS